MHKAHAEKMCLSLAPGSLRTTGSLAAGRQLPHGRTGSVQAEYSASVARLYGTNKLCKIRFQKFIGAKWCKLPGSSYFDLDVVYFSLMGA